ncbi:MAG: hypothetical protein IKQ49_01870 [Eubacterium sp.]|nr:hypothetical protein [Eubacterium sp.]MBR6171901.1 hypothetical protein [Eubacterium sp.]
MFWKILLIVGIVIVVIGLIAFIYLMIISKKEGPEMKKDQMREREKELENRYFDDPFSR